jgi:GNAT superfamily N-acetyltransferase
LKTVPGTEIPGKLRRATLADVPALRELIAVSARELGRSDYTPEQIEGALRGAFGVDSQLLRDGTYFAIEAGGRLVGCGGWSRRRTLFGGDDRMDRDASELDPAVDAAKIRAFFVHPDFARRGFGSAILERCERDAIAHGFRRFELMGTLPGVRLYAARGYLPAARVYWPLGDGLTIPFVPMSKAAPPDPLVIERATVADAPAILALQKLAYESEARLYDDWSLPPLVQTLDSMRGDIENLVVLKATLDGTLAGSVRARLAEGTCHVGRLIVQPDRQGGGIGTQLMRALERQREFAQTRRFELFTGSRSEGNIRLYERLGYRRIREQALSPGVTLVFMEKLR